MRETLGNRSVLPRRRQHRLELVWHLGRDHPTTAGGGGEAGHGLNQQRDLLGFQLVAVTGLELFDRFVFVTEPVLDSHAVVGAEDVDSEIVASAGEPKIFLRDTFAEFNIVIVTLVFGGGLQGVPTVEQAEEDGVFTVFPEDQNVVALAAD